MTEKVFGVGSMLILVTGAFAVGIYPAIPLIHLKPSRTARRRSELEEQGRQVYIQNGCTYCHSQYIRPQDQGHGALRISEAGDYVYDKPHLLGSERTGPDLSQEGGVRTDDWHTAHFMNPRYTRPASEMPQFKFLRQEELHALLAYIQSLGGTMADARVQRLTRWRKALQDAFRLGTDRNLSYLHTLVPPVWRTMPSPYPPTPETLDRGRFVYQQQCIGCHGNFGDGNGPAARWLNPKPANFSALRRIGASGGLLYYQVMNGITGSAMMSFKRELESEKIWDVSAYIAVNFIGHSDGGTAPHGIDEVMQPVDENAPPPPPADKVHSPPPTSPALQPEVDRIWRGGALHGIGRAVGRTPSSSGPPKGARR